MAVETDPALRQSGIAFLKRVPYEAASAALFPHLGSRTEAVRRQAMSALELLAGGAFLEKLQGFLSHQDPAVVHAALDHLRKNPNERVLPWLAKVFSSSRTPAVRKKAFSIVEATASARTANLALQALEDDDEDIRFRAIALLSKFPDESHIGPLLRHCRNDSSRDARRGHRRARTAPREVADLERRGPAPALRHEPEGAPARLEDHRDAGAAVDRGRLPAHVPRDLRPVQGPRGRGAAGARAAVHPGLSGSRAILRPGGSRARRVDRRHHPLSRGRPALHPVSVGPGLVAAGPRRDGPGRDPRRIGAPPPAQDAPGPRVQPLRRGRARRVGDAPGPARPARGLQAGDGLHGPAPRDPRRVREDPGPQGRAAPAEDRPGRPEPARQGQGRAARAPARRRGRRRRARVGARLRALRLRFERARPRSPDLLRHARAVVGLGPASGHGHGPVPPHLRPPDAAPHARADRGADAGVDPPDSRRGARGRARDAAPGGLLPQGRGARPLPHERLLRAEGPERGPATGALRDPEPHGRGPAESRSGRSRATRRASSS